MSSLQVPEFDSVTFRMRTGRIEERGTDPETKNKPKYFVGIITDVAEIVVELGCDSSV